MSEDPYFGFILLSNDPYFGAPGVSVPSDLLTMSFNYSFTEGADNDDDFYAKVFDGVSGTIINDFYLDETGSGSVIWDLSVIDPAITLLGLEFQLNSWEPYDAPLLDSTVLLSNVFLETASGPGPAPVPEPSTLILMGTGLFALFGVVRKKFALKK